MIYVTPSHQFPLGMSMSQARRHALLARAYELDAIIIEDDYDSEFRYEGRPTDSLHNLDQRGIVAYVGTFSKTLLPELRLGYAILPPAILEAVIRAKQLTDLHASTLPQWALAKFIAEGCLLKHPPLPHHLCPASRADPGAHGHRPVAVARCGAGQRGLPHGGVVQGPDRSAAGDRTGKKVEVGLYSIKGFYHQQPAKNGLYFGFGAIETLDIDIALDRLRDILQQVA